MGVSRHRCPLRFAVGAGLLILIGSPSPAVGGSPPGRDSLEAGVQILETAVPIAKRCEGTFSGLSRDLSGGRIKTRDQLAARRQKVLNCFSSLTKRLHSARPPLRAALQANGLSEASSQDAVLKKGVVAGYAWLFTQHVKSFATELARASSSIRGAELGRPPTMAVYTFLSLQKHRTLLAKHLQSARREALG